MLELIGQKSFVGDAHSLHLDAIEGFSKTVERLALFLVRHYVDRLRLRLQYHFGAEQETGKNDRPALILRYVLDQIRTFRGYVEQLGVAHAFPVIRDQLLNEVMLILMGKYKETQVRLKEVIRVFFIYLEEVSLFQAKLKDLFGYSCDEQHSLFYFILVFDLSENAE